MSELIRKIEENDLPMLRQLLLEVLKDDQWKEIERLGGMTNHSYKITGMDGQQYLVRLPGDGTEEMINRADERKSTELACRLGIDAQLLHFGESGTKVMRFIPDPQPMDESVMRKEENLKQAAEIFRRLHTCGEDTGVSFDVFEMASLYERLINKSDTPVYDDYEMIKNRVMKIKSIIDLSGEVRLVPCHNDSLIGNWVLDGEGKLYLIDWEYSGMNDPMWDLSCLSIECDYSDDLDIQLLQTYFGRKITLEEKQHFVAAKLFVDYLWTLWGLTRVPYDGAFMQNYADNRYERLKRNLKLYAKIE